MLKQSIFTAVAWLGCGVAAYAQPIMTHLIDAGKFTLEDVREAEKYLRGVSRKGGKP